MIKRLENRLRAHESVLGQLVMFTIKFAQRIKEIDGVLLFLIDERRDKSSPVAQATSLLSPTLFQPAAT